ncbi:MAG: 30S ribosomal protein S6 [Phycisphaerales bacterium]|nr:30S ribosomal protein S6 [Phycisphaerales bacterium]
MSTDTEVRTGVYEGMFLATQAAAASFGDLIEHINTIFERANAEVISMKKWDERRLAYEMDKQKRGVYILTYFNCPTDMVAHLERDVQISDKLLRVLVTSAEHLSEEEIAAHNDRAGLETETKLKAEAGDADANASSSKVHLGAPVASEIAAPAEPAPEAAPEDAPEDAPEATDA